jgi:hypothetical protein
MMVGDSQASVEALADAGAQFVRRMANHAIYEAATRGGADDLAQREFLCECGHLECRRMVPMAIGEFDPGSPAGTIVSHP